MRGDSLIGPKRAAALVVSLSVEAGAGWTTAAGQRSRPTALSEPDRQLGMPSGQLVPSRSQTRAAATSLRRFSSMQRSMTNEILPIKKSVRALPKPPLWS